MIYSKAYITKTEFNEFDVLYVKLMWNGYLHMQPLH